MIVLDTHIWIWWVHGDSALAPALRLGLDAAEQTGLAVSAISCWEVAKLVEHGRLILPCPVLDWLEQALVYPGGRLIELSPRICVESTQLPGTFHRDPADRPPPGCAACHRGRQDFDVCTRSAFSAAS